jgi:NAD(P)-dependent dehydrogenase (short-subunit alcohol dehydrogenase family)
VAQLRLTRVHCHPAVSATPRSVRPYAGTVYAAVWRRRQDRVEAWLGPAARRLRDGGRIVNFSSSVTSLLQSKAAVEAMTSILAKELGGRNITVNVLFCFNHFEFPHSPRIDLVRLARSLV